MSEPRVWEALAALVFLLVFLRRSAGRLAPRVAIAPLVFLISRVPVLIAWGAGAIGMFTMIVVSAQANGKDPYANVPLLFAVSVACGLGVAPLTVGPAFFLVRAFAPPPVLELEPGERLLDELAANHFLGGEARGGKLLVTDRRLAFRPHRFNVQLATWAVPWSDVKAASTTGLRMVLVSTTDGAEHWLVVQHPRDVAATIEERLQQAA